GLVAGLEFLAISRHTVRVLRCPHPAVLRCLLRPLLTQHQVVFPAPAFVAEAFDEEFRVRVLLHEFGIFNEVLLALRGQRPAIEREIDLSEWPCRRFAGLASLAFWLLGLGHDHRPWLCHVLLDRSL